MRDAEVVFVGYGITAPEQKWDDFKGVDVRGKVVLVMNNDPEDDPALFAGKTRLYYGRWNYKYEEARAPRRGRRHHHPHRSFGRLSVAGGAVELDAASSSSCRRRASRASQVRMWATEDAAPQARRARRQGPRRAAQARRVARLQAGAARRQAVGGDQDADRAGANRQRARPAARQRPSSTKEIVVVHRASRSPRHARAGKTATRSTTARSTTPPAWRRCCIAAAKRSPAAAPKRSILFAAVGAEESGLLG